MADRRPEVAPASLPDRTRPQVLTFLGIGHARAQRPQDAIAIAFLNRYPTLLGYCLVASKAHVEDRVHGVSTAQFLRFQAVTQTIARASPPSCRPNGCTPSAWAASRATPTCTGPAPCGAVHPAFVDA
jgi:hypothetical protein